MYILVDISWRLMRLGYRTCFHTLYDENLKKKKKYISRHLNLAYTKTQSTTGKLLILLSFSNDR